MQDQVGILFVVIFFGAIGWFVWSQLKKERRRKAELDALCAKRGWQIARRNEGRQRVTEIAPADQSWRLRIGAPYRRGSGKNSPTVPGYTQFHQPEPAWTAGRAVVSQRMPGGMDRLVGAGGSGLVGFLQNSAVKAVLGPLIGPDFATDLADLRPVEAPPGIELTILATATPQDLDYHALHEAIHGWTPVHSRERTPPAVTLGPEGFAMRLSHTLAEADDIALFADHAAALAHRLAATPIR